ncbi:serine/threonine-protein kinase [Tumidithrix elongata RA019]|uniref:non-specific serine/threonine protein kinase n=1 Tax=Tumidithrix elongata BACA0141 TaxID=2716417 RepID=A0AAW9Q9H6_9CYAN|nr:serine/threonine-protein kinase [Tumidithrix elongata RA019]
MAAKVLDGRYKLIKKLGVGGFGQTFIARDMRRPGTPPCVVKQLKPASDDPNFIREARRLFNTEAETLEKLGKHDQIPQLLAYFEEDQQFYLVQEFIEGKSLHDELNPKVTEEESSDDNDPESLIKMLETSEPPRSKLLSESEVVAILKDVLDILAFVHSEGVIHRDIKPDNLIRRKKDGKMVLIDFGAVKALQEGGAVETSNGESRFTVTIGTPGYMPNEQCAGRPNYSSDLYALGMVAIKALTGLSPTDLPTDPATGELVWRNQARVNNGLAMVLTRMIRYQYTQRYQSAKEVLQGLTAFSISEDTVSKTPTALVPTTGKASSSLTNYQETPVRPHASTSTKTVPKANAQSNSGSGFLVVGLLAMVAITGMSIPIFMRSQQKPATVPTPVPTVVVETTQNPSPSATDPSGKPSPVATPISSSPDPGSLSQALNLEVGKEAIANGTLQAASTNSYLVSVKAGQKLKAALSGAGVVMTVLDASNAPLSSAVGVTSFEGSLPTTGVYMIQIKTSPDVKQANYILKAALTEEATPPTNIAPIEVKVDPKR